MRMRARPCVCESVCMSVSCVCVCVCVDGSSSTSSNLVFYAQSAITVTSGRCLDGMNRFGSPFSSQSKGCGLWTLSCDFVHDFLLKH